MAHYKNGRVAAVGDSVVTKDEYSGIAETGVVIKVFSGDAEGGAIEEVMVIQNNGVTPRWVSACCVHIDDAMQAGPIPSIYSIPPGETTAAPSQVECPVAEAAPPLPEATTPETPPNPA